MAFEHVRLKGLGLAFVTAALVLAAPAAHAFTMDTIANSNGGSRYVDPGDRLEDLANGKTTTTEEQGVGTLRFGVGGSSGLSRNPVGAPLDQRFMDR